MRRIKALVSGLCVPQSRRAALAVLGFYVLTHMACGRPSAFAGAAGCAELMPGPESQAVEGFLPPGAYEEFCFGSVAGETYEFQTCAPGGADFSATLELRDDSLVVIRGVPCAAQSKISWTAPTSRPMRVRVQGSGPTESGNFRLAYRHVPCQPLAVTPEYQAIPGWLTRGEFFDFCFSAVSQQTYEFSTCTPGSAEFASVIEIRGAFAEGPFYTPATPCGLQGRVLWTAPAGGTYRVRLRGAEVRDSGYFELAYRTAPPPPCSRITPAEAYQTARSVLAGFGFKDYCFDARAGDLVEFSTCPPEGGATASPSIQLDSTDGGVPPVVAGRPFCVSGQRVIFRISSDGPHRARLLNQYGGVATVTLAYRLWAPPPCLEIVPLAELQSDTRTLAASSDQDYCFEAVAAETYEFTTCPPTGRMPFSSGLQVQDGTGLQRMAVFDRAVCQQGTRVLFTPAAPGHYRARLSTSGPGGPYTLAYQIVRSPWVPRTPVPVPAEVMNHSVVTVGGLLYLIGSGGFRYSNEVWAYDPTSDQWTRKADLPVAEGLATFGSVTHLNGRLYVFGGGTPSRAVDTIWVYDIAADAWFMGGRMPVPRGGAVVAAVQDKIIIAGGSDTLDTWEYDPETNRLTTRAPRPPVPLTFARGGAVVRAGRPELHLFAPGYLQPHLVYDVFQDVWRSAPPFPFRTDSLSVIAADQYLYVLGGSELTDALIYDPSTDLWLPGPPIFDETRFAAGGVAHNTVLLMGSFRGGGWSNKTYAWVLK